MHPPNPDMRPLQLLGSQNQIDRPLDDRPLIHHRRQSFHA